LLRLFDVIIGSHKHISDIGAIGESLILTMCVGKRHYHHTMKQRTKSLPIPTAITTITESPISPITLTRASDDHTLIGWWLRRFTSKHTLRAYQSDLALFSKVVGRSLRQCVADDMVSLDVWLRENVSNARRQRVIATIKSLFRFAQETGYHSVNPAMAIRVPKPTETLHERILAEDETLTMLTMTKDIRHRAILTLIYAGGLRAGELSGLKWKNLIAREDGKAQLSVLGKGSKTRQILIPAKTHQLIKAYREVLIADITNITNIDESPMFQTSRGSPLHTNQIWRIVKQASERAGLSKKISPHFLRHAHCSHALDAGAPIHLVRQTLGHADLKTTGRYAHARPHESSGEWLKVA
jgi:integrase/recombinase XerD